MEEGEYGAGCSQRQEVAVMKGIARLRLGQVRGDKDGDCDAGEEGIGETRVGSGHKNSGN